jgi:aminopeptidase N
VVRQVPELEVLSNMPALDEDGSSNVVIFATTPPMPSYLVCVIVGYYDKITRLGHQYFLPLCTYVKKSLGAETINKAFHFFLQKNRRWNSYFRVHAPRRI